MFVGTCILLAASAAGLASAEFTLKDLTSTDTFSSPDAYAIQIASRLNFASFWGPAMYVGDQCNFNVSRSSIPQGAILFYEAPTCDPGLPLPGFVQLSDKIGAIVQLYGTVDYLSGNGVIDPNDLPPRFAYDPTSARESLVFLRAHGSDAYKTKLFLLSHPSVNASISYTPDPWTQMYYTPEWFFYEAVMFTFFCFYIPQHAIRSLIFIRRARRKQPLSARHGINLQIVMMSAAVALGIVRNTEYITQVVRDYGNIWVPEVLNQLAWGYGYFILLLSMLLLVLFWSDVLKTSKVKLLMIEKVTARFFIIFCTCAFVILTTLIPLFVYQVTGTSYVRAAGFLLLGAVALLESVGTMIYGGRLLKQLSDIKPIAERGGALHRSPSITETDVESENPSFDPSMNSSTTKTTSRFSFARPGAKSPDLKHDDSDEKRAARAAQKRIKPLTRLIIVSAALLFLATCLSAMASFTTILNSPTTYIAIFMPLASVEITIYGLIIHTMSPIWQERRRRFARDESSSSHLSPMSEEGSLGTPTPYQFSTRAKCGRCLRNWCVY